MTLEEVRQLKVGDVVWMLCLDEEPGTAVKCEVTKPANDCDVVTIKCVGRPDCKGHYPWYGDISKTETEVYEKAISRAESSIESSESSIQYEQDNIAQKKADIEELKAKLAKAKEVENKFKWLANFTSGIVAKTSLTADKDIEGWFKTCDTEQEAYEAFSKHLERKLFKALEKCGYKFAICCDKDIAVVKIDTDNGEFFWGHYYPHLSYGSIRKTNVFDTLEEAEAELKRRKND